MALIFITIVFISGCISEESKVEDTRSKKIEAIKAMEDSKDKNATGTLIDALRDPDFSIRQEAANSLDKLSWNDKSNKNYIYFLIMKEKSDELEKSGKESIINALKENDNALYHKSTIVVDVLNRLGWEPGRVPTGSTFETNSYRNGEGEIKVKNGVNWDALVILTTENNKENVVSKTYVRSNDSWTISKISDGKYDLYFKLGKGWDHDAKRFLIAYRLVKFEDPFEFDTKPNMFGNSYTQLFEITLYEVVGGNAQTEDVDEGEFPR